MMERFVNQFNFSVDLNNKNRYINKMKNNNKEIRFWWVSDLVSDYELGNENEVNFVGKGELNEKKIGRAHV